MHALPLETVQKTASEERHREVGTAGRAAERDDVKDEKRSRLQRQALPGMRCVVVSGAAKADGTVRVRVKGRTGWSHPHRCRHMLASPRLTENQ